MHPCRSCDADDGAICDRSARCTFAPLEVGCCLAPTPSAVVVRHARPRQELGPPNDESRAHPCHFARMRCIVRGATRRNRRLCRPGMFHVKRSSRLNTPTRDPDRRPGEESASDLVKHHGPAHAGRVYDHPSLRTRSTERLSPCDVRSRCRSPRPASIRRRHRLVALLPRGPLPGACCLLPATHYPMTPTVFHEAR